MFPVYKNTCIAILTMQKYYEAPLIIGNLFTLTNC